MVTIDDVRSFATSLPRTTEGLVRDRVKFRVGRIVYVAFSGAVVGGVWSRLGVFDLARLLGLCAVLLAIVLIATRQAARSLGFDKADEIAIVFCGSKKSLASGAPIAAALLTPAAAGIAMIPLMIFHQIQLMACAAIAQRYAQRPD